MIGVSQETAEAEGQAADFLARAQAEIPTLLPTTLADPQTIKPVRDTAAYLRWRINPAADIDSIYRNLYKTGDTVFLDFGQHVTGYLSLEVEGVGTNVDWPARIRFTFGETPGDIAEELYPYKGNLASAWLPDEVLNLDPLPGNFTITRRHAFRYLRIDVLSTSPKFSVRFSKIEVKSITSAQGQALPISSDVQPLAKQIDHVAIDTLRNCMQTVFEDGPRRDQRLWIGDLRLQALSNYVTFRNYGLVKRCLYLLAAFPQEDGLLRACVFEKPAPRHSGDTILDYACIYAALLREYLDQTGDIATCRALWPTVLRQMEIVSGYINADGVFVDPKTIWVFIDWNEKLHRDASMQGVIIFSLRHALVLAEKLGDLASKKRLEDMVEQLAAAARQKFLDPQLQLFVSGPDRQVSWASQAWLSLAGVLSIADTTSLLKRAVGHKEILPPSTPYLYHYVVEAMITHGLKDEADDVIVSYWGGMVRRGADTFWEIYDPDDSLASPYGDVHINSFCHAWSCTPAYFFRKFGLGASQAYGQA